MNTLHGQISSFSGYILVIQINIASCEISKSLFQTARLFSQFPTDIQLFIADPVTVSR